MITAVVDTNVIVRGAITSHASASKGVVDEFFAGNFLLLLSPDALAEIELVMKVDTVRRKHGLTDDEILELSHALQVKCRMIEPKTAVPPSLTRDITDTKWVALAYDGNADFLVTLDRRHLQRLKRVGETKVVSARVFLRTIEEQ